MSVNPEKTNSKVIGDRWRPTKNPPIAKLAFLWFQMSKKCPNAYLFVDQCFYSTPTKTVISLHVTSPIVKGSGNNRYNCFWHRIAWLDLSNRRWQGFTSILSISERGCNAHVKTVVLIVQSLLRTRLSLISSYLFLFRMIFSSSWISCAAVIDQDDPLWTSLDLNFFWYHQTL